MKTAKPPRQIAAAAIPYSCSARFSAKQILNRTKYTAPNIGTAVKQRNLSERLLNNFYENPFLRCLPPPAFLSACVCPSCARRSRQSFRRSSSIPPQSPACQRSLFYISSGVQDWPKNPLPQCAAESLRVSSFKKKKKRRAVPRSYDNCGIRSAWGAVCSLSR